MKMKVVTWRLTGSAGVGGSGSEITFSQRLEDSAIEM